MLRGLDVVLATAGAGAMGLVLAAYDPELDRKVGARTRAHVRARRRR